MLLQQRQLILLRHEPSFCGIHREGSVHVLLPYKACPPELRVLT
jgi:hypothetical protein